MRSILRLHSANPLVRRLFRGAAWGVMGAVFTRILALGSSIAIARILKTENFGQFLVIQSTLGTFGVFAGLGLGVVATKFSAELHARDPERLGRILSLVRLTAIYGSIIVAGILAASANFIAAEIFHRPNLSAFVAITSVTVVLLTVDGYNNATLFGLENIRESVKGALGAALIATPITILLTWKFGLSGAVYGVLFSSFSQCTVSHLVLGRVLKSRDIHYRKHSRDEWKVLHDYAVPSLLGGVMVVPVHWLCQALLANTPGGMVQVAVLGVGLQWFQVVYFLPLALGRIVLPVMTDIIVDNGKQQSDVVLKSAILANSIVSVPVAVIIGLFSSEIMRVYGITTPYAWAALTLMVGASAISAICAPVGQVMIAKGKIWLGWMMNVGWALIYVGLTYLLLDLGALGVASSLLIAYIGHSIWVSTWTWSSFRSVS